MSPKPGRQVVAITGATGYLGSGVAAQFADRGWGVRRLARRGDPADDRVAFMLGDPISGEALAGVQVLIHCAYDFGPSRREDIWRVNVLGSRALFAAARAAGVPTAVYISSISAFDGCASLYGKAKLEIEAAAREYGAAVIRPGLMFGTPPGATFGRLVAQVRGSRILPLIGDGSQIQYLVHRDDVAGFVLRLGLAELEIPLRPVTIAHRRPWPLRELLRTIGAGMGRTPVLVPVPWRGIWAGLKLAELLGRPLNFRSDSVVSLMNQDPAPDFTVAERLGVICRPFP